MPVYQLLCPQCRHQFGGMVFAGTRPPELWICPRCGGEQAKPRDDRPALAHPLESGHASGCSCCSGAGAEHRTKSAE